MSHGSLRTKGREKEGKGKKCNVEEWKNKKNIGKIVRKLQNSKGKRKWVNNKIEKKKRENIRRNEKEKEMVKGNSKVMRKERDMEMKKRKIKQAKNR